MSLALCADDFGASIAIDEAIDRLVHRRRLGLVSAQVTGPTWTVAARRIDRWPAEVGVGMHLNLTEGVPSSAELRMHWAEFPRLSRLLFLAHTNAVPLAAVGIELETQILTFQERAGRRPAYIDGHQHVHHLPGVRDFVLAAARAGGLAVRNTGRVLGPAFVIKRNVIEQTGGRALQHELRQQGLAHNATLLGVYNFRERDYRGLFRQWLGTQSSAEKTGTTALLFCHPGDAIGLDPGNDPIAGARVREATYLDSEHFEHDLRQAGVTLGPGFSIPVPEHPGLARETTSND